MGWRTKLIEFVSFVGAGALVVIAVGLLAVGILIVGLVLWGISLLFWVSVAAAFLWLLQLAGVWQFNWLHAVILGLLIKILKPTFRININSSSQGGR